MSTWKKTLILLTVLTCLSVMTFHTVENRYLVAGDNIYEQIKRFMEVFQLVRQYYVEDIDSEEVVTGAIKGMLEQLDPHSVYIESKKLKKIDEQFDGHYHGIGIEFVIKDKVLTIISPIAGSPSEALGLRPGDMIIKIEGHSAYGITEQEVFNKLRGPKGSRVDVTIKRPGLDDPFDVTIIRDKIPIYSVMASFIIENDIGYIYLGRFAKTTSEELEGALLDLENQGMKKLLLDLRGNSGGFLNQAIEVADKFIEGKQKIVYTRGRRPETNDDFYSSDRTTHPHFPIIILIDKGSASASEIVAGAVQDLDRGLIVGETSFGKGLVQNQIPMKDGSALRLTTARYFTPSGRLIQRPYDNGIMDYYEDAYDDVDPNSIADSTKDKPVFYTLAGREVYGGGGITPDIKIKSKRLSKVVTELISKRAFFEFGSQYATQHKYLADDEKAFENFEIDQKVMDQFKKSIKHFNLKISDKDIQDNFDEIKVFIKSEIARNLWDSKKYYQYRRMGDTQVNEALKYFPQAAKIAGIAMNQDIQVR